MAQIWTIFHFIPVLSGGDCRDLSLQDLAHIVVDVLFAWVVRIVLPEMETRMTQIIGFTIR